MPPHLKIEFEAHLFDKAIRKDNKESKIRVNGIFFSFVCVSKV